jgi:hypothetical protein
VYGIDPIEQCMSGNCGCGTVPNAGENGRPWWQYALLGAGVAGVLYVAGKRSYMRRNPDKLSPDEATKQAAAIAIQAGIPTILWGPPGIGKTQWVKGLGNAMAFMNDGQPVDVITVIGSTKDPTDIGGMPRPDGSLRPPKWAHQLLENSMVGKRSILFLDEFSSMSPMVHAALLRVVNEKVAGETDFDPVNAPLGGRAVHIVCAANRPKHGAGSRDLPPPAANRLIHFEWPRPTAAEWAEGMLYKWRSPFYYKLPADWRESPMWKSAFERIGTFLKHRDTKASPILFKMPGIKEKTDEGYRATGGAWPSPRSWELAGEAWAATMAAVGPDGVEGAPVDVQLKTVEGAVGSAAAGELFAFAKYKDLPAPEDILAAPKKWKVPGDTIKQFIISNTLVNAVKGRPTDKRYDAAWKAIAHMIDAHDDVPTLTVAARELAAMKLDPRYKEVLEDYPPPKWAAKKFAKAFKKMKLY